jgi:hypothetical protein
MTKNESSDWPTIPPLSLFAMIQNNNEGSSEEGCSEEEEADETSSSSISISSSKQYNTQEESTSTEGAPLGHRQYSRGSTRTSSNLLLPSSSTAFPWMLYRMLEDAEQQGFQDIISWLPSGKGFKVHDQVRFVGTITKMCFSQTHYKSFQRQLNLYGFQRITTIGPSKGGYTHEFLARGEPEKCRFMVRTKNKGMGRTTKLASLATRVPNRATPPLHKCGAAAAGGSTFPAVEEEEEEEEEHTSSIMMKTTHPPQASSLTYSRIQMASSSIYHCSTDVAGNHSSTTNNSTRRRTDMIRSAEEEEEDHENEDILLPAPALNNITPDGQVWLPAPRISTIPLIQPFLSHMQSSLVYEGNTHTAIPAEIADEIIAIFGTGQLRTYSV